MIKYSLYVCITIYIYIYGRICKFVCVQDLVQFETLKMTLLSTYVLGPCAKLLFLKLKSDEKKNHTGLFSQLFFLRNKRPDVPKT